MSREPSRARRLFALLGLLLGLLPAQLLGIALSTACNPANGARGEHAAGSSTATAGAAESAGSAQIPAPTASALGVPAPAPASSARDGARDAPGPARLELAASGPIRVIDLHVDTPWRVHFKDRPVTLPEGHATVATLTAGHYGGVVYPIYIPDYIHDDKPEIADAEAIFATIDKLVAAHELLVPGFGGPVPADRVAVFVSIEGAGAFASDVGRIDEFIARGVRLVGPAHARDNLLAGSATGKKRGGLTALGKEFCERVYRAGALVDVSHLSDKSFDDVVTIARRVEAPIVATHSNARKLRAHRRNLTDAQLTVIKDTGGVVGLNLHRGFLGGGTMRDVVAMTKHLVRVAGVDHVAIGSDFDGGNPTSALKDAARLPELALALAEAGMRDADLRKLFAENALRILNWRR